MTAGSSNSKTLKSKKTRAPGLFFYAAEDIGDAPFSIYSTLIEYRCGLSKPTLYLGLSSVLFSAVLPRQEVKMLGLIFCGSLGFRMGWVSC